MSDPHSPHENHQLDKNTITENDLIDPAPAVIMHTFRRIVLKGLIIGALLILCGGMVALAATRLWNGGGVNVDWNNGANWGGTAPVSLDDLVFGGSTKLINNNNLSAGTVFNSLTFNNTAGSFTLGGNPLTLNGNIVNNSVNAQTINLGVQLNNNITINANSGNLTLNNINNGGFGLRFTGSAAKTNQVNGVISGAGPLTNASGYTRLLGSNTYSGATIVNGGTLEINNTNGLSGTSGLIVSNGGKLFINIVAPLVDLTLMGFYNNAPGKTLTVTGNGSLLTNNNENNTILGRFAGNQQLLISNGGQVDFSEGGLTLGQAGANNRVVVTGNGSALSLSRTFIIGADSVSNSLTVEAGGRLSSGEQLLLGLGNSSSNNKVLISGIGSTAAVQSVVLGSAGAFNRMTVSNGGTLISSNSMEIGLGIAGGNNLLTITGVGTTLKMLGPSTITIGIGSSSNSMIVDNGGRVDTSTFVVGGTALTSNNNLLINGSGSMLYSTNYLRVGSLGDHTTMIVSNGGDVFNGGLLEVGAFDSSDNTLIIVSGLGSTLTNSGSAHIGAAGDRARLVVSNSAEVILSNTLTIGYYSPSSSNNVTIDGAFSSLTITESLIVGREGNNNLFQLTNSSSFAVTNIIVGQTTNSSGNAVLLNAGTRLDVTNAAGTGLYDIRRGSNVQNAASAFIDNLLVTNTQGRYILNSGSLTINGNTTNDNGMVFGVGNGVNAASYSAEGGNHVFMTGITVSNQSDMFMTNNLIISPSTVLLSGGDFDVQGIVTNQGFFDNRSNLFDINVEDSAAGDQFVVTAGLSNSALINLNNESGGAGNGNLTGFQGITYSGSVANFTNTGSIRWNFSAPPSGGFGTVEDPYFGGLRSVNNIFAAYQDASGFFSSGFTATGLSSGQYLKSSFTGGYYYLVIIPEPSTCGLWLLGICLWFAGWGFKKSKLLFWILCLGLFSPVLLKSEESQTTVEAPFNITSLQGQVSIARYDSLMSLPPMVVSPGADIPMQPIDQTSQAEKVILMTPEKSSTGWEIWSRIKAHQAGYSVPSPMSSLFVPVSIREKISSGQIVKTGPDSFVTMQTGKSVVMMRPDSVLYIETATAKSQAQRKVVIHLVQGAAIFNIEKTTPETSFVIDTPLATTSFSGQTTAGDGQRILFSVKLDNDNNKMDSGVPGATVMATQVNYVKEGNIKGEPKPNVLVNRSKLDEKNMTINGTIPFENFSYEQVQEMNQDDIVIYTPNPVLPDPEAEPDQQQGIETLSTSPVIP